MFFIKKSIVGVKSEIQQGTAVALTPTDFFFAEVTFVKSIFTTFDNKQTRNFNDTLNIFSHTKFSEIRLRVELKAISTLYTLFKTFSLQPTFIPPDTTQFVLDSSIPLGMSSPSTSATIEWYVDGFKHRLYGAIATSAKFSFSVSEISYLDITLAGKYESPVLASLPSYSIDSEYLPPIFVNTTVLLNSIPCNFITRIELDFGIEIFRRNDVSDTTGFGNYILLYTKLNGSINPEINSLSYFSYAENNIPISLEWTVGSIFENYFHFYLDNIQVQRINTIQRNGVLSATLPFICNRTNTDTSSFLLEVVTLPPP